jgi:FMN-dependent NADH-azoreductase
MTTLQLNTSIFGRAGESSRLASEFVAQRGGRVIVRDLARDPVPHLDGERFQALLAKHPTPAQQAVRAYSDALIQELRQAETIVIGLPMYNFSIPSTLRAWFDHVARAGVTFKYTEKGSVGLLSGKKAYVFVTRGGVYGPDHAQSAYVREMLAFIGIADIDFVYAEGLAVGPQAKHNALARAREAIARLNEQEPALT